MSPSHRRAHLFSIFHYERTASAGAALAKMIQEMLGRKAERGNGGDFR